MTRAAKRSLSALMNARGIKHISAWSSSLQGSLAERKGPFRRLNITLVCHHSQHLSRGEKRRCVFVCRPGQTGATSSLFVCSSSSPNQQADAAGH